MLEQQRCRQAHQRTHQQHRHGGNRQHQMKRVVLFGIDDAKRRLFCQTAYQKEIQQKGDRSHDRQFPKSVEKYHVGHAAGFYGDVIADHRVDHDKHHENGKNHFLYFVFGHKKSS